MRLRGEGVTEQTTSDAAERVRELRSIAAEVAHPRASVLAAIGELDLQPGMQVLDVGCGPGVHLPLFAERVSPDGSVTGLDIELDRLAIAAEICADLVSAGMVRLEPGAGTTLPFASDAFDVAWASAVLHHVEDPGAMLAEMTRVVRPGGMVAILDADSGVAFPSMPWPSDLEERVRTASWLAAADNYGGKLDHFFDGNLGRKLPRLVREAGLIDQQMHAVSDVEREPLDARREEQLRDWFRGWLEERLHDYLAPRDEARFRALFDPSSDDYLLNDPDFFFSRTWFLVTGRKAA
jgi:ubiquinone/menaquinone biosynthesis C-methylase UbiE